MKAITILAIALSIQFHCGCRENSTEPAKAVTIYETSFEPGDSTAIVDWVIFDGNGALRRSWASVSTDAPLGGSNALVLDVPLPDYPQYVNAMRLFPRIDGTHRYRLSVWMKRSGSCWAGVGSANLDRSSTTGAIRSWSFGTGTGVGASDTSWKPYTAEGNVTIGVNDSLAVYLRVDSLAGKFDLISLERLD